MSISKDFLELFSHEHPILELRYGVSGKTENVRVQNKLGLSPDAASRSFLESITHFPKLDKFRLFYEKYDGAEIFRTIGLCSGKDSSLLELKRASDIEPFSKRYMPGGDRSWTIDTNKSKSLYRDTARWIVFAEINGGPACLALFLNGENAGCVFYITPQPHFNILRPIAKDFLLLQKRIAKDAAGFMRLIRATVCLRGNDEDNYGFLPFGYVHGVEADKLVLSKEPIKSPRFYVHQM